MSISKMTELIICTTCRTAATPQPLPPAGEALWAAVQAAHAFGDTTNWADIAVRDVSCLGACSHGCTIAIQAADKWRYVFGELTPTDEAAKQLLDCAVLHHLAADGSLPRDQRPAILVPNMIARIPPNL